MPLKVVLIAITLALFAAPSIADVGMSITVGEPGFFGHIEIGDAPRPVLVAPRAVIVERVSPAVVVAPMYLYVPAVESKNWRRYCGRYNACGRPVYFVEERWYRDVYVPHYRKHRVEHDRQKHADHVDHGDHKQGKKAGHGGKDHKK